MAIDTATKRFSMLNWRNGGRGCRPGPVASGTLDRQHFLGRYSGISWDPPAITATAHIHDLLRRTISLLTSRRQKDEQDQRDLLGMWR